MKPDDLPDSATIYNSHGNDNIVVDVIEVLCHAIDCEVYDIKPLYYSVDPGGLKDIVQSPGFEFTSFKHMGCTISIFEDGTIAVES